MNYINNGIEFIANKGYVFKNIKTGLVCSKIRIGKNTNFNDYEVIEETIIVNKEETEEMSISERISNLENNLLVTDDRIEFVEGCLLEMSEAVYA